MDDDTSRPLGRPRGEPTRTYQVKLSPAVADWAKALPEGLSGMLRRLLEEEKARQGADAHPSQTAKRESARG